VAEAVVLIGGHGRDPNSEQHHKAGDEIEPAVGKRSEHRHRRGLDRGIGLEHDQGHRHRDAGKRRPRGQHRSLRLGCRRFAHG